MEIEAADKLSFKKATLSYSGTGLFTDIVLGYLNNSESLKPFYGLRPEPDSFGKQMARKKENYQFRTEFAEALKTQYQKAKLKSPGLEKLASENTFTVTTGHQVCLFTGPLYFFYKILSAVKTCQVLSQKYPENNFIPVFWMATEDHDFEEANHFHLPAGKIEWESGQGGAVGRMKTEGMEQLAQSLQKELGLGYASGELIELFKKAYVKHATIGEATRYLVHQLFGQLGVLVVDGDDRELKKLMIPAFEQELFQQKSHKAIKETNEQLKEHYDLQVHQREINLFYLDDQLRERIEKLDGDKFGVVNTDITFSESELKKELHDHPERFSPNVVLRPLYQETVMPNLAYIGGGGELAYWFQLKKMFDSFDIAFPILMLRNSVMMINSDTAATMQKLEIDFRDVFQPAMELENQLIKANTFKTLNLGEEHKELQGQFEAMAEKLANIDATLEKSVMSGYARTERILKNLEKKMLRAERKKQDVLTHRLHSVMARIFPSGGLQERSMNFAPYYLAYGKEMIEGILENIDPFEGEFTVLEGV
jgi:bacillithiol biosynthesis cysteine-adding enzyme BshC